MTKKRDFSKSDPDIIIMPFELGFMLSSPALVLARGKQKISLTLKLPENSYQITTNAINALGGLAQMWVKDSDTGKLTECITGNFIKEAFVIYITDVEGWRCLERFEVFLNKKEASVIFLVELDQDNENLVPLDKEIHSGEFESKWPCMKFFLNKHVLNLPNDIFKHFIIESIILKAYVSEVRDMTFSNSLGQLDNSIPFTPFGPIPEIGSYLRIENPLIFQKNLSRFAMNFDWNGLPQDKNGFMDYYDAYNPTIKNESFKAMISQTRNLDCRHDHNNLQEFDLFETKGKSLELSSKNTIEVQMEKLVFNNQIKLSDEIKKINNSPLYIVLNQPEMAFGHHIFPNVYSKAAMVKSRFRKRSISLPKQPYTPVLEQLSVDYTNIVKAIWPKN